MLGLLGTVQGMIVCFQGIEGSANVSPSDLAGGIYKALVTTFLGLGVGIPALCLLFFFRNKVQRMTFELSAVAAELTEKLKPVADKQ